MWLIRKCPLFNTFSISRYNNDAKSKSDSCESENVSHFADGDYEYSEDVGSRIDSSSDQGKCVFPDGSCVNQIGSLWSLLHYLSIKGKITER